jgi:hypothetical protein
VVFIQALLPPGRAFKKKQFLKIDKIMEKPRSEWIKRSKQVTSQS